MHYLMTQTKLAEIVMTRQILRNMKAVMIRRKRHNYMMQKTADTTPKTKAARAHARSDIVTSLQLSSGASPSIISSALADTNIQTRSSGSSGRGARGARRSARAMFLERARVDSISTVRLPSSGNSESNKAAR